MSIVYEALRDKPTGLYLLDDTAPFQDYSGYNGAGSSTSTPENHFSLVYGATRSQLFNRACVGSIPSNVFIQGKESHPFSLEAWVRPIDLYGGTKVLPQEYRENVATNPALATATTGWSVWAGTGGTAATSRVTTGGPNNGPFVRGTWSVASTANGDISYAVPAGAITPGEVVSYSVFVRANTARAFQPSIQWQDVNGTPIATSMGTATASVPANTWFLLKMENVTVPEGAIRFKVMSRTITPMAATDIMDATMVVIEKRATVSGYFDGSIPGYEWAGTAYSSVSSTRKDVSQINHFINPSFETVVSPASFAPNGGTVTTSITNTGGAATGTNFARATFTSSNTGTSNTGWNLGSIPTLPGEAISAGFSMRSSRAQTITIYVQFLDVAGNNIGNNTQNVSVTANTWAVFKLENRIAPAGTVNTRVLGYQTAGTTFLTGDTVDIDRVMIMKEPVLPQYFDGSTSGAAWSGTANNSWSYLLPSTGEQQILGHTNSLDGITIDGTVVSFVNKFITSPEARVSYDLQKQRAFHVVATKTKDKISLFIDGQVVGERSLTEKQQADRYSVNSSSLNFGYMNGGQAIALNAIGIYSSALPASSIDRHYKYGRKHVQPDTSSAFGAETIPTSLSNSKVFTSFTWDTDADWNEAQLNNVSVSENMLFPINTNELSGAGFWTDSFSLDQMGTDTYGISLDWDGVNITVDASLDGNTWVAVERGVNISLIPPGFNAFGKELLVRVSFPSGVPTGSAFLRSMTLSAISSNITPLVKARTITMTNASPRREYPVQELNDDWGVYLPSGGTLVISADQSTDAASVHAIEVWIRRTSQTTNPVVLSSGTFYQNGTLSNSTLPLGAWTLLHAIPAAPIAGTITITGPALVGRIGVYEEPLTAGTIANIHAAYSGQNSIPANDSSNIQLTNSTVPVKIYEGDWAILSSI